jgi:hypothetical protein
MDFALQKGILAIYEPEFAHLTMGTRGRRSAPGRPDGDERCH